MNLSISDDGKKLEGIVVYDGFFGSDMIIPTKPKKIYYKIDFKELSFIIIERLNHSVAVSCMEYTPEFSWLGKSHESIGNIIVIQAKWLNWGGNP